MGKKTTGKKGHEREKNNTFEEVINGENGLPTSVEDDVEYRDTQIEAVIECGGDVNEKKKTFKNGDSVDLSASETEVVRKDDVDEEEKRKKIKQENGFGGNDAGLSVSHVETVVKDNREKKENTKLQEVSGNGAEFSVNQTEAVLDRDLHASKKKSKKKQESSSNDFESSASRKEAFMVDNVDINNGNEKDRKDKKRKLEINEYEHETQKPEKKDKRINSADAVSKVKKDSKQEHLGLEENNSLQKNDQVNSGNIAELNERKKSKTRHKEANNNHAADIISSLNDIAEDNLTGKVVRDLRDSEQDIAEVMNGKEGDLKKKKKKKKNEQWQGDKGGDDGTVFIDGRDVEAGREKEQLEKVENQRKEKNRKRKEHDDDAQAEELHNANREVENIVDNESTGHSSRNEAGNRKMEGDAVHKEDGKKKKKKAKSVRKSPRTKKGFEATDPSENSTVTERSKKVSFSDKVQVFPSDGSSNDKNAEDDELVRGKRFSVEEDEMIRKSVTNYIETRGLGEEGLNMVLHCRSHSEVKNCWKEIGAALPWRPSESIYYRAHILFERDENRKWTPEELELVRKFHEKHGSDWKRLAHALGKHRFHVKDAWRRIRLPNQKKGQWSQEEYQKLFDLVNLDLRMKASEEKKSKHGMLRDNISWEAISDKLETRSNAICCMKWYDQLTSPMVAEGKWADTDDYGLVNALSALDACCMDDVDWDNLLEHRSGTICQKRWNQMAKHLGPDANKSFPEQVEILSTRYSLDVLEAREAYNSQQQC